MKARRSLFLILTLVLALVGTGGLWVWKAKRQYALDRQLIAALVHNDSEQALALVNAGADSNTRYYPPPAPALKLLFNQLLHRSPVPAGDGPTAFQLVCGAKYYSELDFLPYTSNPPEDVRLFRVMLAHGADCNATFIAGGNSLCMAAYCNYNEMVRLLLEHGADVNQRVPSGLTPLMLAIQRGYTDQAQLLLEHSADVSLADNHESTALHYAVFKHSSMSILRLLMAHGADPNHLNMYGSTPLKYAQRQNRPDIVALLREKR